VTDSQTGADECSFLCGRGISREERDERDEREDREEREEREEKLMMLADA